MWWAYNSMKESPWAAAAFREARDHVLVKAHDEWQVSHRRYLSESSMPLLTPQPQEVATPELMTA
jgi:putative transposase